MPRLAKVGVNAGVGGTKPCHHGRVSPVPSRAQQEPQCGKQGSGKAAPHTLLPLASTIMRHTATGSRGPRPQTVPAGRQPATACIIRRSMPVKAAVSNTSHIRGSSCRCWMLMPGSRCGSVESPKVACTTLRSSRRGTADQREPSLPHVSVCPPPPECGRARQGALALHRRLGRLQPQCLRVVRACAANHDGQETQRMQSGRCRSSSALGGRVEEGTPKGGACAAGSGRSGPHSV